MGRSSQTGVFPADKVPAGHPPEQMGNGGDKPPRSSGRSRAAQRLVRLTGHERGPRLAQLRAARPWLTSIPHSLNSTRSGPPPTRYGAVTALTQLGSLPRDRSSRYRATASSLEGDDLHTVPALDAILERRHTRDGNAGRRGCGNEAATAASTPGVPPWMVSPPPAPASGTILCPLPAAVAAPPRCTVLRSDLPDAASRPRRYLPCRPARRRGG